MKKFIFIAVVAVLISTGIAHGATNGCTNPKALNYDSTATVDNGSCKFPQGGGDPMKVSQPWGLTGYETDKVAIKLKAGEKDCPLFYGRLGCWDLTPIVGYQQKMADWYWGFHR